MYQQRISNKKLNKLMVDFNSGLQVEWSSTDGSIWFQADWIPFNFSSMVCLDSCFLLHFSPGRRYNYGLSKQTLGNVNGISDILFLPISFCCILKWGKWSEKINYRCHLCEIMFCKASIVIYYYYFFFGIFFNLWNINLWYY